MALPLRVAPGDRTLSDAEWAEVAQDVMHRTGIAERGDDGGCRWIAVRHDEHSVHLVAVLARQDGRAVRLSHDHLKVRQACRDAEARLGLTATAPADRTAATHTTRAEVEKAARTRGPDALPDRQWLREQVQLAALQTTNAREFLQQLTTAGVLVRERRDPDGTLTGYAVARHGEQGGQVGQQAVYFGGGKLAPDLSLPKLQVRWRSQTAATTRVPDPPHGARRSEALRARALLEEASRTVREAASDPSSPAASEAGALAQATADVLNAAARVLEGDSSGRLARAARQYDRAAREPGAPPSRVTPRSRALREVGRALLVGGRLGDSGTAMLLGQVLLLVDNIRQLREAQGRLAQAQAARRSVQQLQWAVQEQQRTAARTAAARARALSRTAAGSARRPGPSLPPPAAGRRL